MQGLNKKQKKKEITERAKIERFDKETEGCTFSPRLTKFVSAKKKGPDK